MSRRRWRVQIVAAIVFGGVLQGCVVASAGLLRSDPYEIPAQWLDDDGPLRPYAVDFRFTSIRNVRGHGVVALADNLVLRITDGRPYVTLGWRVRRFDPSAPDDAVVRLDNGNLVFAGFRRTSASSGSPLGRTQYEGFFRLKRNGGWSSLEAPAVPPSEDGWHVRSLFHLAGDEFLAVIDEFLPDEGAEMRLVAGEARWLSHYYRWAGGQWSPVEMPPLPGNYANTLGVCRSTNGALWFLHEVFEPGPDSRIVSRRAAFSRLRNGVWESHAVAPPAGGHVGWYLGHLVCARDGRVWASGGSTLKPSIIAADIVGFGGTPLLYVFDGEWKQFHDLPGWRSETANADSTGLAGLAGVGSLAEGPDGHIWIGYWGYEGVRTQALHRFDGERWRTYDLPHIAEAPRYGPPAIAFDDAGVGWGIANDFGNAVTPENHGILLRFDGERWKLQQWRWSLLRQRWFGLLGNRR